MVNSWLAIGRRRALEEDEPTAFGTGVHTALENIALIPLLHHLIGDGGQIQGASFRETSGHGMLSNCGKRIRSQSREDNPDPSRLERSYLTDLQHIGHAGFCNGHACHVDDAVPIGDR